MPLLPIFPYRSETRSRRRHHIGSRHLSKARTRLSISAPGHVPRVRQSRATDQDNAHIDDLSVDHLDVRDGWRAGHQIGMRVEQDQRLLIVTE